MTQPDPDPGAEQGGEPDYRFSLANERTFLAWIRTSLALVAGGVGLKAVAFEFGHPQVAITSAVLASALGGVLAVMAWRHWRAVQAAMRANRPMPPQRAVIVVTAGLVGLAAVLAIAAAL